MNYQKKNWSLARVFLLDLSFGAGSKFWLNKNGYMSDAYWIIVTKQLCKGIHDFPVSLCFYFMYSI